MISISQRFATVAVTTANVRPLASVPAREGTRGHAVSAGNVLPVTLLSLSSLTNEFAN